MGRSLGGIGRMVARSGAVIAGGFAAFGVASLKAAGDFEQTLNTFQAVTKSTGKEMKAVSGLAKNLGRDLTLPNTSARDAAEAMTELAKGGLTVNQVLKATRGVLQLSTAAQIGNAEAARITARALKAFNLEGTEAGRVADILTNAANASTGEITDFAMGLQMSSAVAHQFGLSINENVAALMTLADAGVVGSDAGTSLKTMLQRLIPVSAEATGLMKDLGINVFDAHGKFIGIQPALAAYNKGLAGLSQEQRISALQTLFGSDAIRAANILLKDGSKALDENITKTERHGSAAQLAAAKTKGFAGALEGFKSTFETLLITAGTPLLKFGTTVVRGLAGAVAAFDTFVQKIAAAKTIKAKFQVVWEGVKGAATSLAEQFNKYFLEGWTTSSARMGDAAGAGPMKTFHAGLLAQIAGLPWSGFGERIIEGILGGLKEAPKIGKRLAAIIESTMAGVPWDKVGVSLGPGLVTAFASAIITALDPVFWFKHWELAFALGLAVFGKGLGRFAGKLVPLLSTKLAAAVAAGTLRFSGRLSGALFDAFVLAGVGVARGGALLAKGVGKAIQGAFAAIRRLGGRFGGVLAFTVKVLGIEAAIRALVGFASAAGSAVADAASAVASAASGIGRPVIDGLSRTLSWVRSHWPEIATILAGPVFGPVVALATDAFGVRSALINALEGLGPKVDGLAAKIGSSIVSGITGGLGGAAGAVTSAMGSVVGAVSGAVGRVTSAATAIGHGIVNGIKGGVAGVVSWLAGQMGALVSAVSGAVGAATGAAARWGAGVLSGIRSGLADLVGLVTRAIGTAVSVVAAAVGTAASAAARVGAGILNGIRAGVAPIVGFVAGKIGDVVETVSGAVGRALGAATAVGAAIVDGIVRGLASLVQEVKGSLDRLWGIISNVAGLAGGAAVAIGSAIIGGIVSGLSGLVGRVSGAIVGGVKGAISGSIGRLTGSPEVTAAIPIGHGIMAAVIRGVHDRESTVGKAIADSTKRAVAGAAQGNLGHWLGRGLVQGLTRALSEGAGQVASAAGEMVGATKGAAVQGMNDVGRAIVAAAQKYGVDAKAALAVAMGEGGVKFGAVGDSGTSFGPFQLHIGGASPYGDPKKAAEFANSIEGIDYALRKMSEAGAKGKTGADAINAIVRLFERPLDPDSSVRNAIARYAKLPAEIGNALQPVASQVGKALATTGPVLLGQLVEIARAVKEASKTIGLGQARGIVEGFVQGEPTLVQQIKQKLRQAVAIAEIVKGEAKTLGLGHAQAIANGITQGSPGIVAQVRQAMAAAKKAMVDAARDAVSSARDTFRTAFDGLSTAALAAFDKVNTTNWKSKFRIEIDKAQLDDQIKQLQDAITAGATGVKEAQTSLSEAMAGGDPEKIKSAQAAVLAAQNTMGQAVRAQQMFNLEQLAKADEEAHAKDIERKRVQFETKLNQLKTELAKHPQEHKRIQAEINALLAANIPGYAQSGANIGAEVAKGIRSAIGEVTRAVRELARAISRRLKLKSPAEEGELSDIDTWWSSLPAMLVASLDLAPIKGAGGRIAAALRGGIDESIGTGNPLEKFSSSLNTSFANLKTTFSGLEEAVRPATATLAVFSEPMQTLAGASETAATSVSTATTKISKLPPLLTTLGKTVTELEPTISKLLVQPIIALGGAADQAEDQIMGMRDALLLLDGTRADTYLTNHITNIVDNVANPVKPPNDGSPPPSGPPGTRPTYGRPFALGGLVTKPTLALVGEAGPEVIVPLKKLKESLSGESFKTVLQQVPRMAEGGIVKSPTLAMIGEKGPEAVVPLGGIGQVDLGGFVTPLKNALTDLGRWIKSLLDGIRTLAPAATPKPANVNVKVGAPAPSPAPEFRTQVSKVGDSFASFTTTLESLNQSVRLTVPKLETTIGGLATATTPASAEGLAREGVAAATSFVANLDTLPRLAKGGVVDRPTVAMIGEAGPEAVIPLRRGGMGGGGRERVNLDVTLMLDKEVVGRFVLEDIRRKGRRDILSLPS